LKKKKKKEKKKKDCQKEKRCYNRYGFPINAGDYIVEATPQQIDQFLKTGCVDISSLGINPNQHSHIICDGCNAEAFTGKRFNCSTCPDFDFCEPCYNKLNQTHFGGKHKFELIEKNVPFTKIETHIIHEKDEKKIKKEEKKEEKKKIVEEKKRRKENQEGRKENWKRWKEN